jgi:hypothetical protein
MFNTEGGAPHVLLPSLNLASFMLSSLNDYDDDEDEIDENESDEEENNEVGLVSILQAHLKVY